MTDFIVSVPDSLTEDEILERIDFDRLPRHVAVIMDGNRRWAKKNKKPGFMGHRQGTETFREIVTTCCDLGIEYLTAYAFSMENWRRTQDEVSFLMDLFVEYCRSEKQLMKDMSIRFRVIGERKGLSPKVAAIFDEVEEYTKDGERLGLNVCINYGSRYEILQAALKLAEEIKAGRIDPEKVVEDDFSNYLYTSGMPDPDLLIRTSGELRISNYLLWQSAYAEFWFTDLLWPDFKRRELLKAIVDYQGRDRRFGGGKA